MLDKNKDLVFSCLEIFYIARS